MEVLKTEDIKEEVADTGSLSNIKVSREIEYTKQMTFKRDIPVYESIKYDKSVKKEEIYSDDTEMSIKTEIDDIKDEVVIEDCELGYEQLTSIKSGDYKIDLSNEYMGYTDAKCFVSLKRLDLDCVQYVNDTEIIKQEENVGNYTSNGNVVDIEKLNALQQNNADIDDIKEDIDIEEHELSYEQLISNQTEDYRIDDGNEYIERRATQCYVLLNKLDFLQGQYVNGLVTIKSEQNVEEENTSDSSSLDMRKQKAFQQCQLDCDEYEIENVGMYEVKRKNSLLGHCRHENNTEPNQSLLSYKAEDKSLSRAYIKVTHKKNVKYFKCHFCEYITKRMDTLKLHVTRRHNEDGEFYQCLNCQYKTKVKKNLIQHCKVQHNKNTKWLQCDLCDYKAKNKRYILKHHRLKHNDAVETFKCELCGFETNNKYYLLQHHKTKHDDLAEIFHCELCDFKTKYKCSLLLHHRLKHEHAAKIQIFNCELCDFKTKYKRNLLLHHRSKHDDRAEYFRCELCNFKTKHKGSMWHHHRSKHDETVEIFHCELCDFKTKYKKNLSLHNSSQHADC